MLLVSGNHYFKDMIEISEEIGEYCDSSIVKPLDNTTKFNLLGQDAVREIFRENIAVEIQKFGL